MRNILFLALLLASFVAADAQATIRRPMYPAVSGGSVTFGASTRGADFGAGSSKTWTSPSVSGSNTVGIVMCYTSNDASVSGITWNGVAMTEIAGAADVGTFLRLQAFYIIAPAGGATNVIASTAGTWGNFFASAVYVTGAHQTTPIDTSGKNTTGASTSFSSNATTNNANEIVIDQIVLATPGSASPTAPSTVMNSGNNGNDSWATSYQSVTSAGSPTMAWTTDTSSTWQWTWVSIKPA